MPSNYLRLRLLCGAGGYPPNVLQPTETYCSNPALVSPFHLQARSTSDDGKAKGETMGEKCPINLAYNCDFYGKCRVLLHAANLRHETDGFTSPPKESMLGIFSPRKIRRLRPGLNPRTWVPEASMLTTRPPKSL
jgi:hypothetical protein